MADMEDPTRRWRSLGMYSILTLGVALWLVYGLLIGARPIVVANAVTLALALFILAMKLH
jgi:MtN3 and saliva related transmembrane protein